ncbi:ribonucleotide-diphosphate reductase subunit alpha (plasmid) [Paenibacillus larvae subsp. pulvifaciens]|uniref:Ribonucleoside-diphosphate reductase n=1 Tax=Paenibacillus larvae subsp. pulvifaciens TaxID=1477 RepID=A0A1V0UZK4_9BACL|nr:class 1b ribonucleoside-diphosphate reductase subunit alpha [Paenibacillus larvae]ARF70672.1 ribonucleotide-diphosphate reductase subunit alpha [Paenibacillus larvae subsp. pulvifaciens]
MKYFELNNQVTIRKDRFFQLEKDIEAVKEFQREVKRKLVKFNSIEERLKYLMENHFYYNVYEQYTNNQINEIFKIAYSYEFKFQSFMAISKFYNEYALKTNDKKKYLETYEDRVAIVALYLAKGDYEYAVQLVRGMMEQRYQPATPTFLNAGKKKRGEMVSCFLLNMGDNLNSINFNLSSAMQLSKLGGGVAIDLSRLRARGESIKDVQGAAKGVLPVMKLLEDAFSYADQMGQRKGAGAVYLNIFHYDVIEFLQTKKINVDEKSRIQSLSVGLIVENKFFELAKENKEFYMFAPNSVFKEYGIQFCDMDMSLMYDKLVKNKNIIKKSMNARDMLTMIASTQMESGYPYLFFKTNANEHHALKDIGEIKISNLCTEIMQLQEESIINNYGEKDEINRDINCNLGSVNIVNVMETKKIRDTIHLAIEALTNVSDMTDIKNVPTVKKANEELHAVGLGAMNLHGYFAKNRIMYESKEAIDFVRTFFMMMNFYSLEKSMLIAKEKGTFKDFEKSEYAKGTYFDMYLNEDFNPQTDKIKNLFEGIHIPKQEDWKNLKEKVQKHGLYNAYRLATAPTQSIGYLQNSTASVMPIVDAIETRTYAKSTTYYPMPYLERGNFFYYKSAYNMNQYKIIDLIAEMQRHVDQGISTILFIDTNTTTRELARLYVYAAHKKLKSLYYIRTKLLSVEECTACSV